VTSPHDQSQYQVRFDWGLEGAETVAADVDVIVVVDVLSPMPLDLPGSRAAVIAGDLRNRTAVAGWVLARQAEKGDRFSVAVIAAGEEREDGSIRFAVEDLLGAGAIVDALAGVGIDYCSPEAAAACAAFTGLRNAVGHLVSASASGKELIARGFVRDTELAAQVDVSTVVPVLREYAFGL
jgi:2-phosphosulfolactate phosphatase